VHNNPNEKEEMRRMKSFIITDEWMYDDSV